MPSSPLSDTASKLRVRALRLERAGDLPGALAAYEAALAAAPDHPELLTSLARLAGRLEMRDVAARLWERASALQPESLEAIDGHACALRDLGRFDAAVAILQSAIQAHPLEPRLWTTLGVTLNQQGNPELALTFFDEAVRLDERSAVAAYNRGGAYFDLNRLEEAQADFQRARKLARKPTETAMIEFASSTLMLARGDLGEGWDAYEARFARDLPKPVTFDAPGRRWTPAAPLEGKHLLVIGEQGLGDEIMFANVLRDLLEALGPQGRLTLAVETRLVDLLARSFPAAQVTAHATERVEGKLRRSVPAMPKERPVDLWTPLASPLRALRRSLDAFPTAGGYLQPDPARVAHWRAWLGAGPPAVGISWRSGKMLGDRRRLYPHQDQWTPLLLTPGVRFVNLQYGDCDAELQAFREQGAVILEAPGLNLREDIDDLAALCAALDLVVSVQNATGALAGACGCPAVFLSNPSSWPRLGSDGYPWYPTVRGLACAAVGEWGPVMDQAAQVVTELAASAR